MECDNFDGSICLNLESNNYAKDCDIDCEYKKEKELKEICERLKERNIIIEYGCNLAHTNYCILLNLELVNHKTQLDALLVEEFKKIGYDAYTDNVGDEVFVKLN